MGHAVADMRVYCHEALHLKDKYQTAHYEPEVVVWESDSDDNNEEYDSDLEIEKLIM